MARLNLSLNFEDVQTAVGSWKTLASVKAPANQMLAIKRVKICGEGTAGDAKPFGVRLTRITADSGTGTGSTPQKLHNALTATAQSAGRVNFTAEPTESGTAPYLHVGKFHPQGGSVDELAFDEILLKEGTEIALQVKTPSGGAATNLTGHIVYEE